jgi:hypothetical protein
MLDSPGTATSMSLVGRLSMIGARRMILCLDHARGRSAAEELKYPGNPTMFRHFNPYRDIVQVRSGWAYLTRAFACQTCVIGMSGCRPLLGTNVNLVERSLDRLRKRISPVCGFAASSGELAANSRACVACNINPSMCPLSATLSTA